MSNKSESEPDYDNLVLKMTGKGTKSKTEEGVEDIEGTVWGLEDVLRREFAKMKQQLLDEEMPSGLLKKCIEVELDAEAFPRIAALETRLGAAEQILREFLKEPKLIQTGIVTENAQETEKPSTINPKKLRLRDFIPSDWKQRKEERELDEV